MKIILTGKKEVVSATIHTNDDNSLRIDEDFIEKIFVGVLSESNNNKTIEILVDKSISKLEIVPHKYIKKYILNSYESNNIIYNFKTNADEVEVKNLSFNKASFHNTNIYLRYSKAINLVISQKITCNGSVEPEKRLNIHNSKIDLCIINGNYKKIDYKNSSIAKSYINNGRQTNLINIKSFLIESSTCKEIYVGERIRILTVKNSIVEMINANSALRILSLRSKNGNVLDANSFTVKTFEFDSYDIKHRWYKDQYSHLEITKKILILHSINKGLNKKLHNDLMFSINLNNKKTIFYWIHRLLTGFGYRTYRLIFWVLITIAVNSLLYFVFENSLSETNLTIIESLYLSGMAFTTTGFGDVAPVHYFSRIFSVLESIIGIAFLSMLFSSFTKNEYKY